MGVVFCLLFLLLFSFKHVLYFCHHIFSLLMYRLCFNLQWQMIENWSMAWYTNVFCDCAECSKRYLHVHATLFCFPNFWLLTINVIPERHRVRSACLLQHFLRCTTKQYRPTIIRLCFKLNSFWLILCQRFLIMHILILLVRLTWC